MEDVSKNRLDVKTDEREVLFANEENEWAIRLGELAVRKPKKKSSGPKKMNKLKRTSSRQLTAIGR